MDVHSSYSFYKIKSLLQTQIKKYMRRFFFHLWNGSKKAVTDSFYCVPLYVF